VDGPRSTLDRDGWLALALVVLSQVEVWIVGSADGPRTVMAPALAAAAGSLAWRRRRPVVPVLALGIGFGAAIAVMAMRDDWPGEPRSVAMLAVWVLVAYSAAAYGSRPVAVAGLLLVTSMSVVRAGLDPGLEWEPVSTLFVAIPWVAGRAIRRQRQQADELRRLARELEREREERARAAVVEERTRIARELHDVVAHSVSVIAVQADAAEAALARDPERSRAPVAAIKQTARDALVEMRRLLGLLRQGDHETQLGPQPGLADLGTLFRDARAAGLELDVAIEGERTQLPAGVDLSAYRIVQEGLTNVRKHSGTDRARVELRYGPDALDVAVLDDGPGNRNGGGSGHGLVGIRERVALHGGTMRAGPRPGAGYALRVRLPIGGGTA